MQLVSCETQLNPTHRKVKKLEPYPGCSQPRDNIVIVYKQINIDCNIAVQKYSTFDVCNIYYFVLI